MGRPKGVRTQSASQEARTPSAPAPRPAAWRRHLLSILLAIGSFLLLLNVGEVLPPAIYLGCLVFFPVGIWLGRASRRPWLDGLIYGGISALLLGLILLIGSEMGLIGLLAGFFLALPQGLLGTWLGARLLPLADETAPAKRGRGRKG